MPATTHRTSRGVTLIELMVALAVFAIGVSMAAPAFFEFRQRQAIKAGAEEYMAFLAERRFEAVKTNQITAVDFTTVGARLPSGVTVAVAPTMGTAGVVQIDPRRGTLTNVADVGAVTLANGNYRLRFNVNALARGSICVPSGPSIGGYASC